MKIDSKRPLNFLKHTVSMQEVICDTIIGHIVHWVWVSSPDGSSPSPSPQGSSPRVRVLRKGLQYTVGLEYYITGYGTSCIADFSDKMTTGVAGSRRWQTSLPHLEVYVLHVSYLLPCSLINVFPFRNHWFSRPISKPYDAWSTLISPLSAGMLVLGLGLGLDVSLRTTWKSLALALVMKAKSLALDLA